MTGQEIPAIVVLANNNERVERAFIQKMMELGKKTGSA